jgi:DNA mismatch endonuclease (patch repair protein)
MQRQRERDTDPEMALRRELHRRGFRYRIHVRLLPIRRTVDLAFSTERVAVEVRGCFWHLCPEHTTYPKANAEWWRAKLERNRARDLDTASKLADANW